MADSLKPQRSKAYAALYQTNLSSRLMSALQVLTGIGTSNFFTVSDIVREMLSRASIKLKEEEVQDLIKYAAVIFSTKYANRAKTNVHRSFERITSLHGGRAAYGYRIGAALAIPYRDTQQIQSEKAGDAVASYAQEHFTELFSDLIKTVPLTELNNMMLDILGEVERRNNELIIAKAQVDGQLRKAELELAKAEKELVAAAKPPKPERVVTPKAVPKTKKTAGARGKRVH